MPLMAVWKSDPPPLPATFGSCSSGRFAGAVNGFELKDRRSTTSIVLLCVPLASSDLFGQLTCVEKQLWFCNSPRFISKICLYENCIRPFLGQVTLGCLLHQIMLKAQLCFFFQGLPSARGFVLGFGGAKLSDDLYWSESKKRIALCC